MSKSILNLKKEIDNKGEEKKKKIAIIGDITVYQPTSKQSDFLMDFLEKHINKDTKKIEIAGEDVYKILFKELTDMEDVDKISNEQLKDILDNPSQELEEISDILLDVLYKLQKKLLRRQKNAIRNLDVASMNISLVNDIGKVIEELPDELKNQVKKNIEEQTKITKVDNKKNNVKNKENKPKSSDNKKTTKENSDTKKLEKKEK